MRKLAMLTGLAFVSAFSFGQNITSITCDGGDAQVGGIGEQI